MVEFNYNSVLVPTVFSDQAHKAVDRALKLLSEPDRMTTLHGVMSPITFLVDDPAKETNLGGL